MAAFASALENWNPQDKSASFRRFAQELKEQSKQVFLRDGHHDEIYYFVSEDGQGEVIAVQAKENRDEMVVALKQRIRERNIYGLVHIVEGWTYFRQGTRDHTMRQILEGEIKVSELRPDDRGEALVVQMESREGAHFMWVTPILRHGEKVMLGETISSPEPPGGRFSGLFDKD
jgi:hypothetical protein